MSSSHVDDTIIYARSRCPEQWERAILLIDKPAGWTSFDVIRFLKPRIPARKLGHAGTLDPMATGLLIVLLGRATREMNRFMELPKVYTGTMRLGEVTPSYDAETPVIERKEWTHITSEDLERTRQLFQGPIEQIPPMYSAVKVKGERLYKKARRGEEIARKPRKVHIYSFELLEQQGADVSFRVICSKGTYIRSLAHDFGQHLGVGAHLVALRREAIGPYRVEQAWTPQEFVAQCLSEKEIL